MLVDMGLAFKARSAALILAWMPAPPRLTRDSNLVAAVLVRKSPWWWGGLGLLEQSIECGRCCVAGDGPTDHASSQCRRAVDVDVEALALAVGEPSRIDGSGA